MQLGFGAVIALLLVPGLVGAIVGRYHAARFDSVIEEQIQENQLITRLRSDLMATESSAMHVLEDGNIDRLPQLQASLEKVTGDFDRIDVLDDPAEQRLAAQAGTEWEAAQAVLAPVLSETDILAGGERWDTFNKFQAAVADTKHLVNEIQLRGLRELHDEEASRAAGANTQIFGLTAFGLLAALLSLWIARRLVRSFRSPIEELKQATVALGSGELDHRIEIEEPEEFRSLAVAFNEMAENAEKMRTEEIHTQRMRVVGQLAAGVAHDFNNLLTAVLTSADLLRDQTSDETMRADIDTITEAGERGAQLVQQLLIYARKDVVNTEPVDLSELGVRMKKLLERTLGDQMELVFLLNPDLPPVDADPAQLGQVLINLVLNARDATGPDGRVTIRTALSPDGPPPGEIADPIAGGPHVMLEVSDTGSGIPEDIQDRIFEPFFTTKSRSEGTGLGLSTVQSIVQRFRGSLSVSSSPGQGATFRIYLPVHPAPVAGNGPRLVPSASPDRPLVVLVVEDEGSVLQSVDRILSEAGHRVLAAHSAREAMDLLDSIYGDVDLMLTDVVMPGESGPELAEEIYQRWSDLPVLYMTGYGTEVLERHGLANDARVLFKPFARDELLAAVDASARPDSMVSQVRERLRLE